MATTTTPPAQPQAKAGAIVTVDKFLEARKAEIIKALPKFMRGTADKFIRVTLTALQGDQKLAKAFSTNPGGFYLALLKAAGDGFVPDGHSGHAYLIPYWNSTDRKYDIQYQIGYRGFIDLALRSGKCDSIEAVPVYSNEQFNHEQGLNPILEHKPIHAADRRGDLFAVYAIARLTGVPMDRSPFLVMYKDDVWAIRARAKGAWDTRKNPPTLQGPWKTDEKEMWKKTAVRALAKYLQLSPEMVAAAVRDEYQELGVIEGDPETLKMSDLEPRAVGDPAPAGEHGEHQQHEEHAEQDEQEQQEQQEQQAGAEGATKPGDELVDEKRHLKIVWARARNASKTDLDVHAFVLWKFGIESTKELRVSQVNEVITWADKVDSQKETPEEFVKKAAEIALKKETAEREEKTAKKNEKKSTPPTSGEIFGDKK